MPQPRIQSYDVFRGVLLLGMVIFHGLVNFTTLPFNQELFYWVPLGFVLFLGVVLGQFLVGRSAKKLSLGLKLLALFLIFNVPNFLSSEFSWEALVRGDQTIFSFEILLPMALLIFSTMGLDHFKRMWGALLALCFGALILMYFLEFYSYNLAFLIYGWIGYALALGSNLDSLAKKPWVWLPALIVGVAPSFLVYYFGLVDAAIVLQVLSLYVLSTLVFGNSKGLIFLGKHSLVLYVAHILIIRVALSLS